MNYSLFKSWVICPFGAWGVSREVAEFLKENKAKLSLAPLGNGFKVVKA
jgi:hypothetical protein